MRSTATLDAQLRERLKEAVQLHAGGSADEFGRLVGYTNGGYIREILSSKKPVREALIERVHGVPKLANWFSTLLVQDVATSRNHPLHGSFGEPIDRHTATTPATFVYAGPVAGANGIPVLMTIRVKADGSYEEQRHAVPEGIVSVFSPVPGSYAVKVRGDGLAPAIRDGYFLVIEPGAPCVVGEDVLVTLRTGRMLCMQLLFERADTATLANLNGGEQMTLEREDIASIVPIAALYPPSRWSSP